MRKNGWQGPIDPLQIVTWIMFPLLLVGFYAIFIPVSPKDWAIGFGIAYGCTAVLVFIATFQSTVIDPIDSNIAQNSMGMINLEVSDDQIYCNVCTQYVNKQSRHCRVCDKCVEVFDHHCKWLNNCIGSKNYRWFLWVIFSTLMLSLLQIILGIYLVVNLFSKEHNVLSRVAASFGCPQGKTEDQLCVGDSYGFPRPALIAVLLFYLAVLVPVVYLLIQLTLFHAKLCWENITTYDYIVRERKRLLASNRDRFLNHGQGESKSKSWKSKLAAFFHLRKGTQPTQSSVTPDMTREGAGRNIPEKSTEVERGAAGLNGLQETRAPRGFGAQFASRGSIEEACRTNGLTREEPAIDFHRISSPQSSLITEEMGNTSKDNKTLLIS